MKKFAAVIFSILFFFPYVLAKPGTIATYTIDAEKNAYLHNNRGIEYASEKLYYAAIQEFKIAISLNPRKQSTAVYFNNLGNVYMEIGYPELALDCFENSVVQYSLNFDYYKNLANCYKVLGITDEKLKIYRSKSKENPMFKIMVGLLEEQKGNTKKAIMIFDEFTATEPDLLITPAIRDYTKKITSNLNK